MHNAYRDILAFNAVCNDLAEIMATQGGEAIIEWVDSLGEPDLNAAMRCLALKVEGSVAERRYRLVRFQLRR